MPQEKLVVVLVVLCMCVFVVHIPVDLNDSKQKVKSIPQPPRRLTFDDAQIVNISSIVCDIQLTIQYKYR